MSSPAVAADADQHHQAHQPDSQRKLPSCLSCKKRHLRCDNQVKCQQCEFAQIQCVRKHEYRLRIKSLQRDFSQEQTWLKIPQELVFIKNPNLSEDDLQSLTSSDIGPTGETHTANSALATYGSHSESGPSYTDALEPLAPTISHQSLPLSADGHGPGLLHESASPSTARSIVVSRPPLLRIQSPDVARLLRYYLDHLLVWFDFDDPDLVFRRNVVNQANENSILMQAICALASRQLSNLGKFAPAEAEKHHETCMNSLILSLEPSSAILRDHLFAATVILRTKEEFDTTWHGADFEAHLLGIRSFTMSDWFDENPSPLRQRLFWIALRQEISFSIVKQSALNIKLEHSFTIGPFDLSSEDDWARCTALNLARIVFFSFDENPRTREEYLSLRTSTDELEATIPQSFQPFYESNVSDNHQQLPFPLIWVSSHFGSFALQHLLLCQLLLTCSDPTLPQIGPGSYLAGQKKVVRALDLLQRLCGLGISHPDFGPCMILACIGASICGDSFTEESQREALIDILIRTENEHAYPTASIRRGLLDVWSA